MPRSNLQRFQDFAPFSGERVKTEEGYLEVNVVATSVGVQTYDGADLGLEEGESFGLYRSAKTVFAPETIKSFTGRPVTIGHDGEMINVDTHKMFSVGNAMNDAFPIDDKKLGIRILVTDPDTVRRIEDGDLTGVSLGYACGEILEQGTFEGVKYDAMTDGPMLINHVTLLPKSMPPRVKEARILDSDNSKGNVAMPMTKEDKAEVAKMIADALSKQKSDADEEAKKADAAAEEQAKADAEAKELEDAKAKEEADKADAEVEKEDEKKDKADAAKMDAAVSKRAQILALCDSPMATESNEDLLKAKLGDNFVNVDQAIGFLQASIKLDSKNRLDAQGAFGNSNSGGAEVFSLDAIKNMKGQIMPASIQDTYRTAQQKGMVGQATARNGQSFGESLYTVETSGLMAGEAFTLDGSGNVIRPANATAALAAIGVTSFSQGALNAAITKTENHASGVVYETGDVIPCVIDGYVYVLAGGAIAKGDGVNYDPATKKWTAGGVSTKCAFIADDSGADGDIIAIQINRVA